MQWLKCEFGFECRCSFGLFFTHFFTLIFCLVWFNGFKMRKIKLLSEIVGVS
ncbi:hypothetical protein [uncultured Gammaproteobacteria bacterium]|nr:hypothetical protein BROOK1789B_996 [Bathymodiolus brooksi thiotrophic gill symbiont]CAC9541698.1 hypothetical protein [uncultured Gammaproteobacteria bacterium]CAC9587508.1 hypothetical protein [uncultured Gammaproteobacteria bacterium]CAC9962431.1 hypothetical protein [uncultured Gammaproteobacteria bacterium]CAC9966447.1 hypothetical protein [uncultured Gammaproteobacteria bacterium]